MKLSTLLTLILCFLTQAQQLRAQSTEKTAQAILQEGLALYRSERASWIATDVLMGRKLALDELQGYISYQSQDSVRTIYFQRQQTEAEPLQAKYVFSFPAQDIQLSTVSQQKGRPATPQEQRLFAVRQKVLEELQSGTKLGSPYDLPENTNFNIALLSNNNQLTKAYVLTGPREAALGIGNDFLMTFDKHDQLRSIERLHKSYLPFRLPADHRPLKSAFHSHLKEHPYITVSDICSILLYQDIVPHEQHYVMSEDYVSIFNVPQKNLFIMSRKAWERISKDNK